MPGFIRHPLLQRRPLRQLHLRVPRLVEAVADVEAAEVVEAVAQQLQELRPQQLLRLPEMVLLRQLLQPVQLQVVGEERVVVAQGAEEMALRLQRVELRLFPVMLRLQLHQQGVVEVEDVEVAGELLLRMCRPLLQKVH